MSEPLLLAAVALRHGLLAWWEAHGRRDSRQKPWMFMADGGWPQAQDQLNLYPIWIAEVMLCSAA
jgi:A/G-specific adenine glycosylase